MRLRDGVDPKILCRQHLLGEHNEYHKIFEPAVLKQKNMSGYADVNAVSKMSIIRHKRLLNEMKARGYNHSSPDKLHITHWLRYMRQFELLSASSRQNLKMLLQGYITKGGVYKTACRKCQARYITYLKEKSNANISVQMQRLY